MGSACEAGELYQAILNEKSEERIARIVNFYDYLEVQPLGNNRFMIESSRIGNVNSEEDIRNINRRIISLGERFNKPVVATCDVHFMDPEDEVYRRIIMAGKGFTDADEQISLSCLSESGMTGGHLSGLTGEMRSTISAILFGFSITISRAFAEPRYSNSASISSVV